MFSEIAIEYPEEIKNLNIPLVLVIGDESCYKKFFGSVNGIEMRFIFKSEKVGISRGGSKNGDDLQGILKSNWMVKHLHSYPSVIVLCVSGNSICDEDDLKQLEDDIKKKIGIIYQTYESHLTNHHCRFFIILNQKKKISEEKRQELLQRMVEIKQVMVIFENEGSNNRMVDSIFKLCKLYYKANVENYIKRIEILTKENTRNCILLARLYFKCAYFNEFVKDFVVAIEFESN
jgi:hypothetical protein